MASGAASGPAVRRYVAAVALVGAAATTTLAITSTVRPFPVLVTAILGLAMAVSIYTPLRYHRQGGVHALHVNDGILMGLLVVAPPGLPAIVAAGAALVGNGLRTRDPVKVAFNVGAHASAAVAATVVFHALWDGRPVLSAETIVAVLMASLAYALVDAVVFARLFSLLQGRSFRAVVRDDLRLEIVTAAGNALTGLLIAFLVTTDARSVAFAFLLVAVVHVGYQGYALAMEERQRNERVRPVARRLSEVVATPEATGRYLEAVASLFGAPMADLVLVRGDGTSCHRYRDGRLEPASSAPVEGAAAEALRRLVPVTVERGEGTRAADQLATIGSDAAIAAPIVDDGIAVGALVVYDRHGLEARRAQDVSLLEQLANEAAYALRNAELFASVERERQLLAEESRKLHDIVDAASDGIALIDADGRISTWNPALVDLTGIVADEATGQPWYMALRLRDDRGDDLPIDGPEEMSEARVGHRRSDPVDLQVLRRDGEWRWIRCTFSPVVRDGTGLLGVVLMARDVTSERETSEMKADFVATVSHELRTPLTPLKGFLLTMLDHPGRIDDEQLETYHRSMLRQVERLEALVADLLVVADIDRDRIRLRRSVVPLSLAASDVVAACAADDPDRVELSPSDPEVSVVGDRVAIARVLRALVDNAVKHTEGPIVVRTRRVSDRGVVEVVDQGPGIPARFHERIFERFGRLGDHLTRPTPGTGLGLSIARDLAARLGGELEVRSTPGRGSTFGLSLPLAQPSAVDRDEVAG